ncbi:MAG: NIPSNAP family protein [Betaproteobacteria bacterium]|nr:NIPSNAP family protein [Betaproteobacteria bacterium]
MFVEERMYTLQIGTTAEYFRNYEEFGLKVQLKHLPHMVGYYVTETGSLNMVIHLWAYNDLNQRDKCRAAMQADPDWKVYLAKNRPLMVSQDTRIMKCAPFFVERLKKMLAAAQ